MKSIKYLLASAVCFLLIVCEGHTQVIKNYETEWKEVEVLLQQKNLPQSALEAVKKIYTKAKKDQQQAQILKSLVYLVELQQQTRENNEALAIKEIEKEINTTKEPAASILECYLAGLYWQYYQRHRWQLYDRTNTVGFNKEDIATWTTEDFHKKISELYLQSLQKESLLKQTNLKPFDALIEKGNVRNLRPTLFDLLAHKALDYFKNDERNIKKPAYAFEINQPEAFAPGEEFAAYKFTTKDSLSLYFKALLIYQDLISFHVNDAQPDALIDVDIERIEFVYQASVLENKKALYQQALEKIANKYNNNPVANQARYLLAAFYDNRANQYQPLKDTAYRFDRIKAKEIVEKVVKDSAVKSEGWVNSYNLLQQINHHDFSFEVEKVNVPDQPFRSLVKYKNVEILNFRLIQADDSLQKKAVNFYDEKFWNDLLQTKPVRSWQQALPATNDLQNHAVEIKADALPVGAYILIASSDASFTKQKNTLGAQLFWVSNISYINQGNDYFVLQRQSGQPLKNALVQVYAQQYNYKTYQLERMKYADYKTDKNGFFQIEKAKEKNNNSYSLDIKFENDRLNLNEQIYNYFAYRTEEDTTEKQRTFFFTDRSIYRPGQTVYFKGIVIKGTKNENNIAVNYHTKVFLQNANGEDADSLELTTNDFGSFSGKFALPQNLLNGELSIRDEDDNFVSFSVEEYKRPKFLVAFEKVKESYKVNDSISVTGTANAYAGNTISNASVVYRVVRQPRFIYEWLFKGWLPRTAPLEIAHGETTTNDNGQFSVSFKAIPDESLNKKFDPVFDYHVYADVTDINGETRSQETVISAGYHSVLLKVNLEEHLPVDSLKNISIRTENLNGAYQPSLVTIKFSQLIPANRLIRNRYWEQPDQFVFSKEEFIKLFPHDEYKNENDFHNWEKGETVYAKTDSTRTDAKFSVQSASLKTGYYLVETTLTDKDGDTVKDVHYVELFNPKNKEFNKPEYIWTNDKNFTIEPGEKATIQIGSGAENIYLIKEMEEVENKPTEKFSFTNLSNEKKTFDFLAGEAQRGGFGVTFFFVKDNRFYQSANVIHVPWSNKELTIEYNTFRDKVLPGSQEKWQVKINGNKGEKVAAEMLASLYDASLDQFKMQQWYKPGIWPVYAHLFEWNGHQNFSAILSQQKTNGIDWRSSSKQYDELTFGLKRNIPIRIRGNASEIGLRREQMAKPNAAALQGKVAGIVTDSNALNEVVTVGYGTKKVTPAANPQLIATRKNFNETAFFFPDLRTDKEGDISFSFTMPEALTTWKLQLLAHTKDLAFGLSQKEVVTQKQLMVQPNTPRFLREGDRMELSAKIVNLSAKELTGQASLELLDATTNQPVDGWFQNVFPHQYFTVAAGQSAVVKFPVEVPYQFNKALVWRIVAKAENYSDGEEAALPVLTNKTLVTETMPLPMNETGTKSFLFDKLLNSGKSETLQSQSLTVEYTTNPAWYVVQALPYLMEFPYECTEQTWNRYYANALASQMAKSTPRLKQIFEQWKTADTSALLSNLQKNEELKSVLLQETPWVLQAKTEAQQKKNIALLFDVNKMSSELESNFEKLKQMQSENGGFVWFKGGPDDRFITQYILAGIGHLNKLNGINTQQSNWKEIIENALSYLDQKIKNDYDNLIKHKADLSKQNIGYLQIQYLYLRSFFAEYTLSQDAQTAYKYFNKQAQQFWMKQNKYMQGMIALLLSRSGDNKTAKSILQSLKETSIVSEEMGRHWKENDFGRSWFWWQAPIETQSLLIEAFSEISNDTKTVNELKTWLLKNKQTNNWRTTKATADACYALLLQGANGLNNEPKVAIQLGNTTVTSNQQPTEAGTGYFKQTIEGQKVTPEMGNIKVTIQPSVSAANSSLSWGAVYWQYFEDINKITTASTPLQLIKKLFVEKNTDRGPILRPVNEETVLHVGDKIRVRIELRSDRDMEYVHLKDMRASALEPVNVLSGYRWQGGLGYYETTKDASTNFFFNYLPKGTYVFEYPSFVTHEGNFSNGITTIQCMYAPEFSAHSEGIRIKVGE